MPQGVDGDMENKGKMEREYLSTPADSILNG
jgi:hypothetical protein